MYSNILYATDLLKEHYDLTKKAVYVAEQFKAKLFLLHVIEVPTGSQISQGLGFTELAKPAKDDAQTVLSLLGDSFNIPIKQQFVEIGSVKEQIFKKVTKLNCQLIVLGSQGSFGLHTFIGSTANAAVNHASCDVLTLRV